MPLRVGNTAITTVGKVKLGTTNITKIFRGTTQIWPSTVVSYTFSFGNAYFTASEACSNANNTRNLYSASSSLSIGVILYTDINLTTPYSNENPYSKNVNTVYETNIDGEIVSITNC